MRAIIVVAGVFVGGCMADEPTEVADSAELSIPDGIWIPNVHGASATRSTHGAIDTQSGFFADLGTNDRSCGDCHSMAAGWSVTPKQLQLEFALTRGRAPIFRLNDGATSPNAPVATLEQRRTAYKLLLERGVIRVGIGVPANAEFELVAVDDPYGYASAAELSLFRRPLPATNLRFNPTLMWDGRETPDATRGDTLDTALGHQALGATTGHAQGVDPGAEVLSEIVGFEQALTSAQVVSVSAGRLDAAGARGGLATLATQPAVAGAWNLYGAWATQPPTSARAAIARGEVVFNTARDFAGGTCAGCHDVQHIGTSSISRFFNARVSKPELRKPEQPLYTFRNKTTGEVRSSTDPGRALVTGKWSDMDRFKVPGLRNLAARAPYFHDGSAATLEALVRHYEAQLVFVLTDQQRADLVAYLAAL